MKLLKILELRNEISSLVCRWIKIISSLVTRLRLVTCDEMILIQLQTRDDISFLNSRIFSNSTFHENLNFFSILAYHKIQSPIILPLSSSHPAALIFHFWRKRERKKWRTTTIAYSIVCSSTVYWCSKIESPVAYFLFSQQPPRMASFLQSPTSVLFLQEGGKKTKINLHPLCQARVLSENIRTQVCIIRS